MFEPKSTPLISSSKIDTLPQVSVSYEGSILSTYKMFKVLMNQKITTKIIIRTKHIMVPSRISEDFLNFLPQLQQLQMHIQDNPIIIKIEKTNRINGI